MPKLYEIFGVGLKDWLGPIATVIAALAAAFVTWYIQRANLIINRKKLKIDLFEKRFELYMDLRTSISNVISDPKNSMQSFLAIRARSDKIKFLFGHKIYREINGLLDAIGDVYVGHEMIANDQFDDISRSERSKNISRKYGGLKSVGDFLSKIDEIFFPHLNCSEV